jgi:transposase
MSAVSHATKREARSTKDLWIQSMVARRGKKCTAVALANKTVRTAYAMLTQNTEYKAELI